MTELYENLPSFSDFSELSKEKHYARLPPDWYIIIAYVVDAEEQANTTTTTNNYREVNNMSGGCVTAVKNAILQQKNGSRVPYVFTGDGASFAVPPCCYEIAIGSLLSFRKIVQKNFKSDICIGSMSIKEIEEQSQTYVEVARYEITHGVCIGLFRGGGLAYANTQVGRIGGTANISGNATADTEDDIEGDDSNKSQIPDDAVPPVQVALDGLSCRWTPMPSKYGTVLSILVYENPDRPNSGVYDDVLHELDCILDFNRSNPAHLDRTEFKSFRQMMREDRKFHTTRCSFSYLARLAEMFLGLAVYRWGILKNAIFNSQYYKYSQRDHADYRKFDDMLRMVVDCTVDQAKAIEFVLQDRYNQGHLFFGIFSSSHAVMTCLLEGLEDGQHVHFMDGADGGYTMAAKALREQMHSAMKLKPRSHAATGWSAPSSNVLDNEELGWSQTDTEPYHSDSYQDPSQIFPEVRKRSSLTMPGEHYDDEDLEQASGVGWDDDDELQEQAPPAQFDPLDINATFGIFREEAREEPLVPEKKSKKKSKKKKSIRQPQHDDLDLEVGSGDDLSPTGEPTRSSSRKKSSKKSRKKSKVMKEQQHHEPQQQFSGYPSQ